MLADGGETSSVWNYLDGSGLKSSLAYPNGLTATWTYDANNLLLQACNATPTNIISQYDYTYDAAGRRVSCGKTGSAFAQNDTLSYGYNEKSELTNAVASVDSDYRYAYAFDDIGNRESSSERGTNSVYAANQLNQYTEISDSALSASPRETFTPQFDDDGNQTLIKTSTGIWQVTYNGENRPVQWTLINSSTPNSSTPTLISMSFDRQGRRVTKNDQRFVYNGYLQIANFELQTSNIKLQTFIWDPTEKIATRPLLWNFSTFQPFNFSTSYYTHDGNKNVSEVIVVDCNLAAHYEYAPFGALTAQCGISSASNPWRLSSEYAEDDTATVYYNYRHYEPQTGRWLQRDTLGEMGGINLFGYMYNDFTFFDFLGRCPFENGIASCSEIPCLRNCAKIYYPRLRLVCEYKCNAFKRKFDEWFANNNDMDWIADLPDCPCSIGSAKKSGDSIDDPRWNSLTDSLYGYHVGATLCMRSKPVSGHANQCCYDKCGKLITHGSGSGSADYAPGEFGTFRKHKKSDMDPADWAKSLDGDEWGACSEAYLLRRPEKGAEKCPENP
jgi:RHS repeat-associated protein